MFMKEYSSLQHPVPASTCHSVGFCLMVVLKMFALRVSDTGLFCF